MTEENDVIVSAIEKFLKGNKGKIIPYCKDELKSVEAKKRAFDFKIYNEFSLQHELGIYLRDTLNKKYNDQEEKPYQVFFEKNTKTFLENFVVKKDEEDEQKKHEVDLIIIKKENGKITEKYAIELKFPINGQYPEQMKKFVDDMNFMKQVYGAWEKEKKLKNINTYCLTLVNDHLFYEKANSDNGDYKKFRCKNINADINAEEVISAESPLLNSEHIKWHFLNNCENNKDQIRYYLIDIETGKSV